MSLEGQAHISLSGRGKSGSNMWRINVLSGLWDSPLGHIESLQGSAVTPLSSFTINQYDDATLIFALSVSSIVLVHL